MAIDKINGLVLGKILTGKPHNLHGKIYGFRLRFSQENQSIESKELHHLTARQTFLAFSTSSCGPVSSQRRSFWSWLDCFDFSRHLGGNLIQVSPRAHENSFHGHENFVTESLRSSGRVHGLQNSNRNPCAADAADAILRQICIERTLILIL